MHQSRKKIFIKFLAPRLVGLSAMVAVDMWTWASSNYDALVIFCVATLVLAAWFIRSARKMYEILFVYGMIPINYQ